jgi:hypothetical protein
VLPLTILVRAEAQDVFTTPTDHPEGIFGDVHICVGPAIVDFLTNEFFGLQQCFRFLLAFCAHRPA